MADTFRNLTSDGSTSYTFPFEYLKTADVKVSVDGTAITEYTVPPGAPTTVQFNTGHVPASGAAVRIYRDTSVDNLEATFYAGSAIKSQDLNDNFNQNLYVTQEAKRDVASAWQSGDETIISTETWVSNNERVATTGAIDGRVDAKINTAITTKVVGGDRITATASGGDTITLKVTPSSIQSSDIADGTLVNADINASAAIDGTKISPDFGSQNIATTGTVDGRDVSADGSKLDGIETAATADQTAAEIRTLVEAATDSNVFTDADHSKLNAIEASATADQTDAEIRTAVEAASDSNVFTDADHTKLNAIEASATADQTASEIKTLYESNAQTNPLTDAEKQVIDGVTSNTSELNKLDGYTGSTNDLNIVSGKSFKTSSGTLDTTSDTEIPSSKAIAAHVASSQTAIGGFITIADEVAFPNTQPATGVVISINNAAGVVVNGSGVSTTGRRVDSTVVTINGFPSSLNGETLAAGVGLVVTSTATANTYAYHKLLAAETDVKQLSDDINDFNARYRVASSAPGSSNDAGDMYFDTSANKMKVYNGTTNAWDDVASVGSFYVNTISSSSGTGGGSATFNGSAYRFTLSNAGTSAQQHIVSVNGVIQKPNSGTGVPSEGFAISGNDIIFSTAPASGSDSFIITCGSSVSIGTPSANSVNSSHIIDGSIVDGDISSGAAIAGTKIASLDAAKITSGTLGTARIPNHSAAKLTSGTLPAARIADDSVVEAKLDISNTPTAGYFLQYKDSTDSLTWAAANTPVLTTQGDMLYRDGSGEQRLAKGTANQILTMNTGATAPQWSAPVEGANIASILKLTSL